MDIQSAVCTKQTNQFNHNIMLTLVKITDLISDKLKLPIDVILGTSRATECVAARCILVRIAHDSGKFSDEEIGKFLNKGRFMVHAYLSLFNDYMKMNIDFKAAYSAICRKLRIKNIFAKKGKKIVKPIIETVKYHPPICTYTALEEIRIARAIKSANEFMKKYGQGKKPETLVDDINYYCQ